MKKILIALAFIGLMSTGCKKDYFDVGPTGDVDDAAIFTTTSNANTVINGIYRYLYSRYDQQNQPGHGGVMLMLDFMGEDVHQANSTWYSPGNGTGGWTNHRSDSYGYVAYPFRLYYRCIGNANAIIENIDAAVGTDTDKKRIKAEALTMRAWSYFNLVQIFAKRYDKATAPNNQLGVSMPLSALDVKLPRSTVEEVYTQIKLDLADAITNFAGAPAQPKSHLNLKSAYAIRARVALNMQDYVNAAAYANQVITLGGHSLMTNTQYQAGFNDLSNPEWIWGAYVQDDQGDTFGSYFGQISYNGQTSYVRATPKRINSALYSLLSATDVRKKMWEPAPTAVNFPLPTTGSPFTRTPYMSRKFSIRNQPTIGDVPYIRLAEMYLIIAEANANIPGNEVQARQALYTLQVNRDPAYVLSTNSGAALLAEISNSRRVELWAEGMRWFDLKRKNEPLDRTLVPNYVASTGGGVLQIPAGSELWQFAMPLSELQANPNSVPNP